jgi:hypothetical protein
MSASRFIRALLHKALCQFERRNLLRSTDSESIKSTIADWSKSLADPTEFYRACFQFFHTLLAVELREHRSYFTAAFRGFGEDAFHVMWAMIFERFRPVEFLEIGVYRGQILSLASLLQRRFRIEGTVTGISPFQAVGDSVSSYSKNIDYLEDTRRNIRHFGLPPAILIEAYSTDPKAVQVIESRAWDCVYIDGNHDYDVVKVDWDHCAKAVKLGGLIVLDDSALDTEYRPPRFATGGHPGPSRIAREIDVSEFSEILRVGHNRVFQRRK